MAGNHRDGYLEPTHESGRAFVTRGIAGSVVMLKAQRPTGSTPSTRSRIWRSRAGP
jgi:hypothetical protein